MYYKITYNFFWGGYKRRLLTQTKSSTLSASDEESISDHEVG